jgi:hypothetical protein
MPIINYGGYIQTALYPACFLMLINSIDSSVNALDKDTPEKYLETKLLSPLDELSAIYQSVLKLYADGFTELFPNKYKKKKPTFSEFLAEIDTPQWQKVRNYPTVKQMLDVDMMNRRQILLGNMRKYLKSCLSTRTHTQ